jgi:hypothetical protein
MSPAPRYHGTRREVSDRQHYFARVRHLAHDLHLVAPSLSYADAWERARRLVDRREAAARLSRPGETFPLTLSRRSFWLLFAVAFAGGFCAAVIAVLFITG